MDRSELLQRYRDGYPAFAGALEGITDAELDARASKDEWTAREIVHHLADAEMRSAIRLRQLIAEDGPRIEAYDEPTYAQRLHYERPLGSSLDAIRVARATSIELLDVLTEDEWQRSGTHSESGPYSVMTWLEIYTAHALDHADQVRLARNAARG